MSAVESRIMNSRYSLGLSGMHGWELDGSPQLDFTEVDPSVCFPLSGVMGSSFYRGVLEYKAEAVLGVVTNLSDRGILGLSPVGIRYNFTVLGGRLVPYVDGTLGAVYLNVHRDIQGTRFNFIETVGAGVRYFVTDGLALGAGFRYRHLSNADIRKPNHGLDTGFVVVGLSYY